MHRDGHCFAVGRSRLRADVPAIGRAAAPQQRVRAGGPHPDRRLTQRHALDLDSVEFASIDVCCPLVPCTSILPRLGLLPTTGIVTVGRRLVRLGRPAERARSRERQPRAHDRRRRACRHRVRRQAPVPDRRGAHPQDRSRDRRACWRPFRRPATAATRAWPGPKARSGSASTASARSTRSIPRPAPSCAPSSPTASSPASPGSTASCGTAPGKATRARCAESIPQTGAVLERLEMPRGTGVCGLESDGRRPLLLRRRRQQDGARRAQAEALAGNAATPGARYRSPPAVRSPGSSPPAHRPRATAGRRDQASGTAARGRDK